MDPISPGFGPPSGADRVAQVIGAELFRRALRLERDAHITLMGSHRPQRLRTSSPRRLALLPIRSPQSAIHRA